MVSTGDNIGQGYYLQATVEYTDGEGGSKSAAAGAGQMGTSNTRPQVPASETGQRSVDENTGPGVNIGDPVAAVDPENNSLTYILTGDDAESFTIVSSTGQLRTRAPLDFEEKDTYVVDVEVHDRRDAAGASSTDVDDVQSVTITVTNVDEAGTVTLSTPTNRVQFTVPVTAELDDPDGSVINLSWQWARSTDRSNWTNFATTSSYTPTEEDDNGSYLRATATYDDGHGGSKSAEAQTARVAAAPPANASPPVFPDAEDGQREVAENSDAGTDVGDAVSATDFDGDQLTYTPSGSDAASFSVDSGTGQVSVAQGATLDYETKRTYRFTLTVTDGTGTSNDTITVTVNLTDVNEPPKITGDESPDFPENRTSLVTFYSARDPERDEVTWSVSGADAGSFFITQRGHLYFRQPPDFEDDHGPTYQVTLEASDGSLTGDFDVTVTVTDLEETGTLSIFPTRGWFDTTSTPPAATRFTATLEDGDGIVGSPTWQWARSAVDRIIGAVERYYTATAADVNRTLRVTAEYRDGRTGETDPDKTLTATLASPIGSTRPATNTAPMFAQQSGANLEMRTITSSPTVNRNVGAPVRATDQENDALAYMLRGKDADKFQIDPRTGQIRTKTVLDHLEEDTYILSVSVRDNFDASYRPSMSIDDTVSVIIMVLPPAAAADNTPRRNCNADPNADGHAPAAHAGPPTSTATTTATSAATAPSSHVDADTHGHADAHAGPDTHAQAHVDADTHGHADTNTHADTDAGPDTHTDAHADAHANTEADAHTHGNANADADAHTHGNANTDSDADAHTHADTDAGADADSDAGAPTDTHPHHRAHGQAHHRARRHTRDWAADRSARAGAAGNAGDRRRDTAHPQHPGRGRVHSPAAHDPDRHPGTRQRLRPWRLQLPDTTETMRDLPL